MDAERIALQQYARTGDAEAFATLVRAYAGMVFATARRITRDTHLAEDVTQQAFLLLARQARDVRTNIAGWLHSTATHRALNAVRTRQRATGRALSAARVESTDAAADNDLSELLPAIDAAIAALPDALRLPLVSHFLQAKSQAAVAAELGVDASTVSRRIRQAVESLRTTLRQQGFGAAAGVPAALGQCGPAAVPAGLETALVKIGLGGGVTAAGTKASVLLAAAGVLAMGLIAWTVMVLSRQPVPVVAVPVAATAPATRPTTRPMTPPPAIELIRDAIVHESWIDGVKSLSIEFESVWQPNPRAIAVRRRELQRQFPDMAVTPERFPELRTDAKVTRDLIAFDDRRARSWHEDREMTLLNLWNGQRAFQRAQFPASRQDSISI